jgi:hypothetical protein
MFYKKFQQSETCGDKVENKKKSEIFDRHLLRAGLPDGLFSEQKSEFGYILESLAM